MTRFCRSLCLTLLAIAGVQPSFAQDADWRFDDANTARAALGDNLFGNLTVTRAGVATRCRFHAAAGFFESRCLDGTLHSFGNGQTETDFAWTLLAVALATGELQTTLEWAGMQVPPSLQGFGTLQGPTGQSLVQYVGTPHAGLTLQHDTSQLRQIRALRGTAQWQLTVVSFASLGNGWYPGTLVVSVDDQSVLAVQIDDLAADEASLSPVDAPATRPTPTGAVRFPRLPL